MTDELMTQFINSSQYQNPDGSEFTEEAIDPTEE